MGKFIFTKFGAYSQIFYQKRVHLRKALTNFTLLLPVLSKADLLQSAYITDFEHVKGNWNITIKGTGVIIRTLYREEKNLLCLESYNACRVSCLKKALEHQGMYEVHKYDRAPYNDRTISMCLTQVILVKNSWSKKKKCKFYLFFTFKIINIDNWSWRKLFFFSTYPLSFI